MQIKFDLYQTVAVAVAVYFLGQFLRQKVRILEKYCIPAPVIGGLIFAIFTLIMNTTGILTIEMDTTMQQVFMTLFFTSIGFTASLKLLAKGGLQVFIFVIVCTVLVIIQNAVGLGLAFVFDLDPLIGLCVGSIPMIGGHGTAGSFGVLFDEMGITGASTIAVASATYGLIAGGMIGGPIAKRLIIKNKLATPVNVDPNSEVSEIQKPAEHKYTPHKILKAFSLLFIAAGLGSIISGLIQNTGVTFPSYIGAMLAAAIIRNISDLTNVFDIMEDMIEGLGNVSLLLFLSMALMNLKLWQLADLAGPLVIMLLTQTVVMALFAYFVTFNVMGRDYEAAVMASANCGFGMGATPNAIANMQAITSIYGFAPKAFFIVPLVGSLFIDFANGGILTFLINIFG